MDDKKTSFFYKILYFFVKLFFPKIKVEGMENLPEGEPVIAVGNHAQMNGPIAGELYFPGKHYIWCAGQMMHLKEVPAYAFEDFWSFKSPWTRWFFRLASYAIAPLSVCVFNNAHTVPVYHDSRLITTFRTTIELLKAGNSMVIFPEHNKKYNNIIYDFQEHFVDTARFYYKKTGKELCFVPMYLAPKLKTMYLGRPIRFDAKAPIDAERRRIVTYLMDEISSMAAALPEHTVIPYRNIRHRDYPKNRPIEVCKDEENSR